MSLFCSTIVAVALVDAPVGEGFKAGSKAATFAASSTSIAGELATAPDVPYVVLV